MKPLQKFLCGILVILLTATSFVALAAGTLRYTTLNAGWYKLTLPDKSYISQMRSFIEDDLSYVAILYGFSDDALNGVVTDEDIKNYTDDFVDAFFAAATDGGAVEAPEYPPETFTAFALTNTSWGYEAATNFGEDCAEAVKTSLAAVDSELVTSTISGLTNSTLVQILSKLCWLFAGLLLAFILVLFASAGKAKRGLLLTSGSVFMGASLLFIPVAVFAAKGYTSAVNLSLSAYRVQLVGILDAALRGGLWIGGAALALSLILLVLAIWRTTAKKKPQKAKNQA